MDDRPAEQVVVVTPSKRRPRSNNAIGALHSAFTTRQRLEALSQIQWPPDEPDELRDALLLQLSVVLRRPSTSEIQQLCATLARLPPPEPTIKVLNLLIECCRHGAASSVLSLWHLQSSQHNGSLALLESQAAMDAMIHHLPSPDALGIFKNLTYYCEESRTTLLQWPGLVTKLTQLAMSDRLSAVWRNISLSERKGLVQHGEVLSQWYEGLVHGSVKTIHNLLQCLLSVCMEGEAILLILLHGDGLYPMLIEGMLRESEDSVVRKRCTRLVRLWTNDLTAPLLMQRRSLVSYVSEVAIYDDATEVRKEATETLAALSRLVPSQSSNAILDAWVHLTTTRSAAPSVLIRALHAHRSHATLLERPVLLEALGQLSRYTADHEISPVVQEKGLETILTLVLSDPSRVVGHESMLIAVVSQLDASRVASTRRILAAKAVVALTTTQRQALISYTSLVPSLMQFASVCDDADLKKAAKESILLLLQEL